MVWSDREKLDQEVLIGSSSAQEAEALGQLLSQEGYQIDLAVRPFQAMEKLMTTNFQAAILMLQAEDRSWIEFIPVFNSLLPRLPLIIVAEPESLETERLVRQGRIFYYLLKPVDMVEIKAVLRDASEKAGV
jgi:DNA-binding NtrC family response regulator